MKKELKWLAAAFLFLALLGFADASYLSVQYFRGIVPACSVKGCEQVLTSGYATIGGVPVALFGAAYYLSVFIMALLYLDTKKEAVLKFLSRFVVIGLLASAWFVYLQIFVIQAICFYCAVSAATSAALFIFGLITERKLLNSEFAPSH